MDSSDSSDSLVGQAHMGDENTGDITAIKPTTLTISSLPQELYFELFKHLSFADAVCLGLTNKTSWACFNSSFPEFSSLKFMATLSTNYRVLYNTSHPMKDLHLRLQAWMEPRILVDFGHYSIPVFATTKQRCDEPKHENGERWESY